MLHETPDEGVVNKKYNNKIYSQSIFFFFIANLVNPDIITIMYHLELMPNTYEII
jgi:hypothetical protein